MIHPATLRRLIREVLTLLPPPALSSVAVELLTLTHAHEGTYWGKRAPVTCLWQLGKGLVPKGPALGIYQMEGATHDSLWRNWLFRRREWATAVADFANLAHRVSTVFIARDNGEPPETVKFWQDSVIPVLRHQLPFNLAYATAMARAYYYSAPAPLPSDPTDIPALAAYWHRWWCRGCRGTPEEAAAHYRAFTGADPSPLDIRTT